MNSQKVLGQMVSISSQQSPLKWQAKSQKQSPTEQLPEVQHSVNPAATHEPFAGEDGIAAEETGKGGREGENKLRIGWHRAYRYNITYVGHANFMIPIQPSVNVCIANLAISELYVYIHCTYLTCYSCDV